MATVDDGQLRGTIETLLTQAPGTEAFPRADSHEDVLAVIARLQGAGNDLKAKLAIAGFTLHQGIEQACERCMYYLRPPKILRASRARGAGRAGVVMPAVADMTGLPP